MTNVVQARISRIRGGKTEYKRLPTPTTYGDDWTENEEEARTAPIDEVRKTVEWFNTTRRGHEYEVAPVE